MSWHRTRDRLLDVLAAHPRRVAPHLHMPMQSGDDGVLRAMNRWYDVAEYLRACERIRARLDRPAFTADVLVDNRAMMHVFHKSGLEVKSTLKGQICHLKMPFRKPEDPPPLQPLEE